MVALDVNLLPAGPFDKSVEMILSVCDSILVILSEDSVRLNSVYQAKEVALALQHSKCIVPVVPSTFNWLAAIASAPWIESIKTQNSVVTSYDYRDAFIDRLQRFAAPSPPPPPLELKIPRSLRKRLDSSGANPKSWWKLW